ncbi:sensor histidine kinase [Flavihumibacter fluvii]|uniref:sensor histidine kinase n=1 Tax=Flavihumibacter fluvii TaxID=2838157 RepID=UPI001EFB2413|nr:ATP-binding protein [Flavihumibacter fluvii]ULQ51943.1 ATP-binding protein [Flavihumibacter fluvii]
MIPDGSLTAINARLEKELAEKSLSLARMSRELEVEAAFDKVRDRAMAMRNSAELAETSSVLFQQLTYLGINSIRAGVGIFDEVNGAMEIWLTTRANNQEVVKTLDYVNLHVHPVFENIIPARQQGKPFALTILSGDALKHYYQTMPTYASVRQAASNDREYFYSFFFSQGTINLIAKQALTEEECSIMIRLAKVFGLIYTRFIDLQTAEKQAHEAAIDTALEKVRSRTMAMQVSGELLDVANTLFSELWKLAGRPIQIGVGLQNRENPKCLLYTGSNSPQAEILTRVGWVLPEAHPVLAGMYAHWLRREDFFPIVSGESLHAFYQLVMPGITRNTPDFDQEQYAFFLPFSKGSFFGWCSMPFTDSELSILKRFTALMDLVFCRHLELQQSEANAREVIRQASLNRIRAQIASMRTASDLQEITPLIWNELNILGIPFIRCGVFIMDEGQQLVRTFLSAANGQAIAALNFPYGTEGLPQRALDSWRAQSIHREHWTAQDFTDFWTTLVTTHPTMAEPVHQQQNPPEQLYLHLLPFLQGMLYVGNTEPLGDADMQLLQSVAETFSTAYARYEDFNRLEIAKDQIEHTLTDLRQAQAQLIQAEKMASLGELTAGIAHEIQNPLNFVINFAEITNELIDDIKLQQSRGNHTEVSTLCGDVQLNLQKIQLHGKRADAIVKGMLEHSRSGLGERRLTDLNALIEEYIRLCYHGTKAKDKLFDLAIHTDFDAGLGEVNIIPQDIGKVVFNVLTNAFYAVQERKKQQPEGYDPVVAISTRRQGDKVEIRISDNGTGIPAQLLDKIFQPFFTTKPTGQGTGLGLSLSYDIITRGNGGNLKVNSKEGEGTELVIELPLT